MEKIFGDLCHKAVTFLVIFIGFHVMATSHLLGVGEKKGQFITGETVERVITGLVEKYGNEQGNPIKK